jgi:chromosome segregation ATPase
MPSFFDHEYFNREETSVARPHVFPDAIEAASQHNTSNSGIEAISAKIQERAFQLSEEEQLLEDADRELQIIRKQKLKEDSIRRRIRRKYLDSTVQVHRMEIMNHIAQDEVIRQEASTSKLKEQTKELRRKIQEYEKSWEILLHGNRSEGGQGNGNSNDGVITRQKLASEMYETFLREAISATERTKKNREIKFNTITLAIVKTEDEMQEFMQQQKRIESEVIDLIEKEAQVNKKVEELAEQVRSALAQVRKVNRIKFHMLMWCNAHELFFL